MPEITEKRKLSNIIFNGINKSLNMKKNTISENNIDFILHKLNLQNKTSLSSHEMKIFSQELKSFINQESNKQNIPNQPYINNSKTISESLHEKDTKYIEYLVTIDSNDRNKLIWKYPNEFSINFSPDSDTNFNDILESKKKNIDIDSEKNKGYINRSFNNIESIELIEVILPNIDKNSVGTINYKSKNSEKSLPDDYDNYPYIILDIEELGSSYEGTNNNLCSAFAILSNFDLKGNFRYYSFSKNNKIIKKFNPRIGLNKLTIRFKTPYQKIFSENSNPVNLFDFGMIEKIKGDTIDSISPNILITFKITCIQVSLDTMYINPK